MSKFLKLKSVETDARVLVAVSQVAAVFEAGHGASGSLIQLKDGIELSVKEGYQTVVNRLTKGDEADD